MAPAIIVALIGAGAAIIPPVVNAVDSSKGVPDACKTTCKATCKESHKAIFGGRQKCIKKCEADCYQQAINVADAPPPPPPLIPKWVSTLGIVLVVLGTIWLGWSWFSRRGKAKVA